jgi:hypothetical protein
MIKETADYADVTDRKNLVIATVVGQESLRLPYLLDGSLR